MLALLLRTRSRSKQSSSSSPNPITILNDIVWIGALFAVSFVSSFGFAAGAMISTGDLRGFATAVTFALLGVSALALTRLGFRLAAFSRSVAAETPRRYPVANDHF